MAAGVVLGGMDRLLGNRFGYGEKFEEGFRLLGPTALSMAGMICLAPVLANVLGKAIIPFYQAIGVDPSMFGSVLAIDMGGYQLAKELAIDSSIGSYAGIVVSAILGCTLVFTIPVGMGMIKGFCVLANGIRVLVTVGLMLAAVEFLCGWNPIPGMTPIEDAMSVVSSIGVVLLGSLPAAELLRQLLKKPFTLLGERLGIKPLGFIGMLIGLVSPLPVLSMYQDMDEKGKVTIGAFLVSGTSLLAAHMGFVISTEPAMLPALICGNLSGAIAAAVLTMCFHKEARK